MSVQRIQTLTDCIFAVAMMLMASTFNFPSEDVKNKGLSVFKRR